MQQQQTPTQQRLSYLLYGSMHPFLFFEPIKRMATGLTDLRKQTLNN
jgi:hypothetical protein